MPSTRTVILNLLLLSLLLSACGGNAPATLAPTIPVTMPTQVAPTTIPPTPTLAPTPMPTGPVIEFGGVRFANYILDSRVLAANIPAGEAPAHLQFAFSPYALEAFGGMWQAAVPRIEVYRVDELATSAWADEVDALRALLGSRPDLATQSRLPYLPKLSITQLFHARAQYAEYPDLIGLIYLTMAAPEQVPVLYDSVSYTFQGFTRDGQYYVAATFPMVTKVLPRTREEGQAAVGGDYAAYLTNLVAYLDQTDAISDFAPGLVLVQGMLANFSTQATSASAGRVQRNNLSFAPSGLGAVQISDIPASVFDPNAPPSGDGPAHIEFRFAEYFPSTFTNPQAIQIPRLNVYPTANFAHYRWDGELNALVDLLVNTRDLGSQSLLPFVPVAPAVQVTRAKAHYLNFTGGSGVAYLTFYSQDVLPLTDTALFYTFQGMTSDGRYYIAAQFPVKTAFLPATLEEASNAIVTNYETYVNDVTVQLNSANDGDFTPALSQLDGVIQTLVVTP